MRCDGLLCGSGYVAHAGRKPRGNRWFVRYGRLRSTVAALLPQLPERSIVSSYVAVLMEILGRVAET